MAWDLRTARLRVATHVPDEVDLQHISSHQQAPDDPRPTMTDKAWVPWIIGLPFGQLRQLRRTGRAIP